MNRASLDSIPINIDLYISSAISGMSLPAIEKQIK